MPSSTRISRQGAAAAAWTATEGGEAAAPSSAARAAESRSGRVSTDKPVQRKSMSRSPQGTLRLGRLRAELGRIARQPCDPAQAREEILQALARAGLGDWTLPELDDETTHRCADGSLRLKLLAHSVILNPSGAFRIVDRYAPSTPYFERHGCEQRPFELPGDLPRD